MKKIIALILMTAIIFSFSSVPASALETGLTQSQIANCIFYTDFESGDLGLWEPGVTTTTTDSDSCGVETIDGTKAMKFTAGADSDANMFLDFADVPYADVDQIIIKARIKLTGGSTSYHQFKLKLNRPNIVNFGTGKNEVGHNWYTLGVLRGDAYQTTGVNDHTVGQTVVSTDMANKWVEVEIVFDGINKKAYTTIKVDGQSYGPVTSTTAEITTAESSTMGGAYEAAGADPVNGFDSFDSLTITPRFNENTLYVDYIYAYAIKSVTASLKSNVVYPDDNILISVNHNIPANAVELKDKDGFTVPANITVNDKIITIDPENELTEEETYKAVFNSEVLSANNFESTVAEVPFTVKKLLPLIQEMRFIGKLIPNTTVTADYDYYYEEAEGNSLIEWYVSDNENDGFIKLDDVAGKVLEIDTNLAAKYIRYKVKPVSVSGTESETWYESGVIKPQSAPIISGLTLSSSSLFAGSSVSASYTYSDADGDNENKSEIKWYASDDGVDGWSEVYTGKSFKITDECIDKYLKCMVIPVSNGSYLNRGIEHESESFGPVKSNEELLTSTNLFLNPGLEDGVLTPWEKNPGGSATYKGIELISDDVYSGNYAMRIYPRIVNAYDGWWQILDFEADKTYILSGMAKRAKDSYAAITGWEGYDWNGKFTKVYRDEAYLSVNEKWQRVTTTLVSDKGAGTGYLGFLSFPTLGANVVMDDFYFGELMISDIGNLTVEPVAIPETGSVKVKVTNGEIYNQLGDRGGLWGEKVTVIIPETKGVTVDGDYLVIDSAAIAGKIQIELCCNPTFLGAQGSYSEMTEIELVATSTKPAARNVTVSGDVVVGNTLNATYEFYQAEGKNDASAVNWMYADTENGPYQEIPGATNLNYVVESAYADKFICIKVIPKTNDGGVGDAVYSNVIANPRAPIAQNIKISGDFKVGGTITATYDFYDANKDAEGTSTYRWMIADSIDGRFVPIQNQTSVNLTFTEDIIGKYVKFGVTPVSQTAPFNGTEAFSKAVIGPVAPIASNVEISRSENRLTGSYTYSHPHNAKETDSTFKWTVDGAVVSTNASYIIDFTGTRTVGFSVTPVGDTNPSTGQTVTTYVTLTGASEGGNVTGGGFGGGFAGGSSGGSGSVGGVTNINNMQIPVFEVPKEPEKEETKTDIDNHWGKDYIKEMETRGVMSADENGNFDPEKLVSRSEMIVYLFKALGLQETEYTENFGDVPNDAEYAKMLQTMINNGTIASYHEFRPDDGISREEMCKILYVSLENAGKLKKAETNVLDGFTDKGLISDWATDYVNTIYANKIMIGTSDTTFAPKENITKAQVATMLVRILNVMEKEAE